MVCWQWKALINKLLPMVQHPVDSFTFLKSRSGRGGGGRVHSGSTQQQRSASAPRQGRSDRVAADTQGAAAAATLFVTLCIVHSHLSKTCAKGSTEWDCMDATADWVADGQSSFSTRILQLCPLSALSRLDRGADRAAECMAS